VGGKPHPLGEFLKRVEEAVEGRVASDADTLRIYSRDYWPLALLKESKGEELPRPLAVAWPERVEEVIRLVRLCNEYRVPFVPYAGGSGVIGGTMCEGCLVIDVKRMNKVLHFSEEDALVVAESGVLVRRLEEFLNERGFHPEAHTAVLPRGSPRRSHRDDEHGAVQHKVRRYRRAPDGPRSGGAGRRLDTDAQEHSPEGRHGA